MTATKVHVEQTAADPKAGLTLAEIAAFLNEALDRDIPFDQPVHITAGWRQQLRKIEVDS